MKLTKAQQKRIDNAILIAQKIQGLIDQGCSVYDDTGDRVGCMGAEDRDGCVYVYSADTRHSNCRLIYIIGDPDYDNGLDLTCKQYAAQFKNWTYIYAKDIKKIGGIL